MGSIDARETVKLQGTSLAPNALATRKLGHPDAAGNWPMVLEVSGLPKLKRGGYYDLYLTKDGRPIVSCGTVNTRGTTVVRLSAAYALEKFDEDGWVSAATNAACVTGIFAAKSCSTASA